MSSQGMGMSPGHTFSILDHPETSDRQGTVVISGSSKVQQTFCPIIRGADVSTTGHWLMIGDAKSNRHIRGTVETEQAFIAVKQALTTAAHL